MASIQFREDVHRAGVFGPWSAVVLPGGAQCSALRLPVTEDQEDVIERVVEATQTVRDASLAGVAPVADVIVGGGEVWLLVAMPPAPSIDDLVESHRFTAAEIAVIATDVGKTLQALHHAGLAHGALAPRTVVLARSGASILTEAGLAAALGDPSTFATPATPAPAGTDPPGTDPPGTDSAGTYPAGADSAGSYPAGTDPAGADSAGSYPAGADSAGTDSAGSYPAGTYPAGTNHELASTEPVPIAEQFRADIEAWCEIVAGLADLLRIDDDRTADADVLDRCVRRARTVGLASGLHALSTVARRFPGFPSRASLSDAVRARSAGDATLANIMGGIDALFAGETDEALTGAPLTAAPLTVPPLTVPPLTALPTTPLTMPEKPAASPLVPAAAVMSSDALLLPMQAAPVEVGAPVREPVGAASAFAPSAPWPRVGDPGTDRPVPVAAMALASDPYAPVDPWSGDPPADSPSAGTMLLADRLPPPVPPAWPARPTPSSLGGEPMLRIGPGVPTSQLVRPTRLGRRGVRQRLALNVGLVLAIIVSLVGLRWWATHQALHVKSVSVRVEEHVSTGCSLDADIIGTINTSGGSGVISYRWRRNDGTTTDIQTVRADGSGQPVVVHLRWNFTGYGQQTAGVALVVVQPQEKQAETSFIYRCVASG